MKLQQLFSYFETKSISVEDALLDASNSDVSGIFFDARHVIKDSVFIAIKGSQTDGHLFIPQAIQNGAVAIVVENKSSVPSEFSGKVLVVKDTRRALDQIAAIYYDFPSEQLFCFGVTGTNGKTSITYFLEHILNQVQKYVGVVGTVNHRLREKSWPSGMTTPDPITVQKRLREFIDEGAVAVAMEITSHALDQKRADSVQFNTVIFTNLTLDHLDYHKTMDHYFAAKQRLFIDLLWMTTKKPTFAIVNTDDQYGRKLQVAESATIWTYGQKESDFQFTILKMTYAETEFELKTPTETILIKVPFSGAHMIYNCVASMVAALSIGVRLEQSIRAMATFFGVPGRLQKVVGHSEKTVFVDYAHTPDALENVLKSLVEIRALNGKKNKIITVFGCGGDRDKSKRPVMGKIAETLSDFVFITSDNPRTENPLAIVSEIEAGLSKDFKKFIIEPDREKAIAKAIQLATSEDVVLIAGKGHEDYQILGTEKIYFSDIEVAQRYLRD